MKQFFDFDTYSPAEIAAKVESVGVTKARMPLLPMAMLECWRAGSSPGCLVFHPGGERRQSGIRGEPGARRVVFRWASSWWS